jgi:hypothetical protein
MDKKLSIPIKIANGDGGWDFLRIPYTKGQRGSKINSINPIKENKLWLNKRK